MGSGMRIVCGFVTGMGICGLQKLDHPRDGTHSFDPHRVYPVGTKVIELTDEEVLNLYATLTLVTNGWTAEPEDKLLDSLESIRHKVLDRKLEA